MKLYYAPHTCSLSPLIVLHELDLPHQLVKVDNQTKRTEDGRDFRAINPKGYVAALELDNGAVLTEGPAILQYLADLKPEAGLAPAPASWPRVRLQEMLNFITSEIHAGISPLFHADLPRDYCLARLQRRLVTLETALGEHSFVMGEHFTVADAYLYTVLGWLPFFSVGLEPWPALAAWQQRIAARPSVQAAMQAHV